MQVPRGKEGVDRDRMCYPHCRASAKAMNEMDRRQPESKARGHPVLKGLVSFVRVPILGLFVHLLVYGLVYLLS